VVGTFHILPYSRLTGLANHGLALLNRRSGKRFDAMLAVSEPARQFAQRVYGYDAKVVPNPIWLEHFKTPASKSADLNVVFLGRLVPRKGAQHLLHAAAYVREHRLFTGEFKVIIGGKGELLPLLQAYSRDHGLDDIVTLAGFINETDKAAFLAQGDVVAYPSTAGESFGIVLLEAFAAARGVVLAGNNPGYSSVMAPYPDQLFDPHDEAALATKLAHYLADAQARQAATKAQRAYVLRFDVAEVGRQLLSVYAQALQKRRKA
jgi:phosphatidylinositol alpha-mannosyltransferase